MHFLSRSSSLNATCHVKRLIGYVRGVARIFQRGGSHCVKHYRYGVFAIEYYRLFFLNKSYKGGFTGTPGPPPRYAHVRVIITILGCDHALELLVDYIIPN